MRKPATEQVLFVVIVFCVMGATILGLIRDGLL